MTGFIRKMVDASHNARLAQLRQFESEELDRMRRDSLTRETAQHAARIQRLTTHPSPVYR